MTSRVERLGALRIETVTRAPAFTRWPAMSMPEFPAPTTSTSRSRYAWADRNSDEWISSGVNSLFPATVEIRDRVPASGDYEVASKQLAGGRLQPPHGIGTLNLDECRVEVHTDPVAVREKSSRYPTMSSRVGFLPQLRDMPLPCSFDIGRHELSLSSAYLVRQHAPTASEASMTTVLKPRLPKPNAAASPADPAPTTITSCRSATGPSPATRGEGSAISAFVWSSTASDLHGAQDDLPTPSVPQVGRIAKVASRQERVVRAPRDRCFSWIEAGVDPSDRSTLSGSGG